MQKIKNVSIAKELDETSSNISNLKRFNPKKYEIVKLGTYLYQENITEDELLPLLEIYKQMKKSFSQVL